MASTFTNLLYHIVFSTKKRQPLITSELKKDLYAYVGGIIRGEGGKLLEINGMPDHVHLVVKLKADCSVANIVRLIKANSSKWVNEKRKGQRFAWQTGYAAFSVSESQLAKVRVYVKNQEKHHRKTTFKEELIAFLTKNGIEYDEKYLLD